MEKGKWYIKVHGEEYLIFQNNTINDEKWLKP